MALSAGVLVVDIDGEIVEIEGSFSIMPNTIKREPVVSQSGKVFAKTTPVHCGFKGTLLVTDQITGAWYAGITDKGCSVRIRGGRSYSFDGCYSVGELEHNGVDGTAEIEVFAQSCTEEQE